MGIQLKKGNAPATGKVKQSRQELLLAQQAELARDQIPESFTMDAITGSGAPPATSEAPRGTEPNPLSPQPLLVAEPESPSSTGLPAGVASGQTIQLMPVAEIQRSPFQPKGRPSASAIAAIESAITTAGSLTTLLGQEGAIAFNRLDVEAKRLAELAYDVQQRGVTDPIEVRSTDDGSIECLRGHRRMAAAKLAGLLEVPTLNRGAMSNAQAAATVLSGNLHRENFTTWQEAVLVAQVQEQRRANNQPHNVRSLGAIMGWSHGKVQKLLAMRRVLSPEYLHEVGGDQSDAVEDMLSRMSVADLGRVASIEDPSKRTVELHRRLGWSIATSTPSKERAACSHRQKRGGGFELIVARSVEALERGDAIVLLEILETQLGRVRARLDLLNRVPAGAR